MERSRRDLQVGPIARDARTACWAVWFSRRKFSRHSLDGVGKDSSAFRASAQTWGEKKVDRWRSSAIDFFELFIVICNGFGCGWRRVPSTGLWRRDGADWTRFVPPPSRGRCCERDPARDSWPFPWETFWFSSPSPTARRVEMFPVDLMGISTSLNENCAPSAANFVVEVVERAPKFL